MKQTREDIIDLKCHADAVFRKAQCRAVNCEILDMLDKAINIIIDIDDRMTEIIGD